MDLKLKGKLALVTGSTAGIGLAIATTLARTVTQHLNFKQYTQLGTRCVGPMRGIVENFIGASFRTNPVPWMTSAPRARQPREQEM